MSHEEPKDDDVQTTAQGEQGKSEGAEAAAEPEAAPPVVELVDDASDAVEAEIIELVDPRDTRIEELESKLNDAMVKLRTVSKAYTDLQEEQEAFRKRTKQQLEVIAERKAAETVEKFFDPVQNLKRSVEAAPEADDSFAQGVRMVLKQFQETLTRLGLEPVPGVGSDFDPNAHEALAVTPVADPSQDGKILMVHTDGYRVKGRTIQAAQVIIGKYEAPVVEQAAPVADDGAEADDGADEAEELEN